MSGLGVMGTDQSTRRHVENQSKASVLIVTSSRWTSHRFRSKWLLWSTKIFV